MVSAGFLVDLLGEGPVVVILKCLCPNGITPPLAGPGVSNPLGFAFRSFCSLSAFRRVPEDGNTNGGLLVSGPEEPRAQGPTPQCALREQRPVTPVCLTSGRAPSSPSLRPVQGNTELRAYCRLCLCSRLSRSNTRKLCDTQTPPILL